MINIEGPSCFCFDTEKVNNHFSCLLVDRIIAILLELRKVSREYLASNKTTNI
jgi:hypothetical protein